MSDLVRLLHASDRVILPLGDAALIVRLGTALDPAVNRSVHALAQSIRQAQWPGVIEVCPAYVDLAVYYDPLLTDFESLSSAIGALPLSNGAFSGRHVEIPVRYGGSFGPDLPDVARLVGLAPDEVAAAHSAPCYTVFMIGFLPGFPYMGVVPERLAVPRLPVPRPRVPAGSVGLALRQTGIYPSDAPGGWRIIGRTDVNLFDPQRDEPCLLRPGDEVRFVAV